MTTHSGILVWRIPWIEEPGESYSPWDHKESDTAEQLIHTHLTHTYTHTHTGMVGRDLSWMTKDTPFTFLSYQNIKILTDSTLSYFPS